MSDLDLAAAQLLISGAVTVFGATPSREVSTVPDIVSAVVQGNNGREAVHMRFQGWQCSCVGWRHQHDGPGDCPHIAAVQLATGHRALGRHAEGVSRW